MLYAKASRRFRELSGNTPVQGAQLWTEGREDKPGFSLAKWENKEDEGRTMGSSDWENKWADRLWDPTGELRHPKGETKNRNTSNESPGAARLPKCLGSWRWLLHNGI